MSAFQVTDRTINAMIQGLSYRLTRDCGGSGAYYFNSEPHRAAGDEQRIGQVLTDENCRSVNYRYKEETEPPVFQWNPFQQEYTPVEILKLCGTYEYQACETPDWEESEAFAIMTAIRRYVIHALPGYADAKGDL